MGKINFREPYIRSVSDKTQRKYFLFNKLDPCNDLHSQYKRFPVQPDLIYSSARASSDPLAIYDFRPQIPVNCGSYSDFVHVDHLVFTIPLSEKIVNGDDPTIEKAISSDAAPQEYFIRQEPRHRYGSGSIITTVLKIKRLYDIM